jgi:hypothetical protein
MRFDVFSVVSHLELHYPSPFPLLTHIHVHYALISAGALCVGRSWGGNDFSGPKKKRRKKMNLEPFIEFPRGSVDERSSARTCLKVEIYDGSACFSVLLMLMLLLMISKQSACSSL